MSASSAAKADPDPICRLLVARPACWWRVLPLLAALLATVPVLAAPVAAAPPATPGTVWAWGADQHGQVGPGGQWSGAQHATMLRLAGPSGTTVRGVIAVAGGSYHSLALRADGTVWTWGDAQDANFPGGALPGPVGGLTNVVAIAAGARHNLALKDDGTVWAWGNDTAGQLGDGAVGGPDLVQAPRPVGRLTDVIAVAAGAVHSLALKSDGTVWAWGNNSYAELGAGTIDAPRAIPTPQPVAHLNNVVAVSAGLGFSLALKADGTVWAWGADDAGQLGDGTLGNPARVAAPQPVVGLGGIVAVAAGGYHGLGLKDDGTVWAWGNDLFGQLGDGTLARPESQSWPRQVPGLGSVAAIAAGMRFSLAMQRDPEQHGATTVWVWGEDASGQLGDGAVAQPLNVASPQKVQGLCNATVIAAGETHSLAITTLPGLPLTGSGGTRAESTQSGWPLAAAFLLTLPLARRAFARQ